VYVNCSSSSVRGNFTITGGTISGNRASIGGGVYVDIGAVSSGIFTMRGGTITGNSAARNGGGVYVRGTFSKTGGTLTGYNSDQVNGNAVKDGDGTIARSGHAAWVESVRTPRRKETTAGPNINLSNSAPDNWDQ
jgi:predicted outer membrane repeat protein